MRREGLASALPKMPPGEKDFYTKSCKSFLAVPFAEKAKKLGKKQKNLDKTTDFSYNYYRKRGTVT